MSIAPPEQHSAAELDWPVHPAAALFPLLPDAELAELADDIRRRGLTHPVWLWNDPDGKTWLLDGRNRVRASALASVRAETRVFNGDELEAVEFAISENVRRRHLTTGQKAAVAYEALPVIEAATAERERRRRAAAAAAQVRDERGRLAAKPAPNVAADRTCADLHTCGESAEHARPKPERAVDLAAAKAGTSGRATAQFKRIAEQTPDLAVKVRSGELALDAAEKELRHRQRVEARRTEDLERQQAAAKPAAATIVHADCLEWLAAAPDADLLLTDPPYSTDVDDIDAFAHDWLPLALSKVKPTGRAYVCIGAYPAELHAYLTVRAGIPEGMVLADVLVWTYRNTLGPSSKLDYSRNWQAILHYRGPEAPPLRTTSLTEKFAVIDMNAPDGRRGERWHTWQKPDGLGEMLVNHATEPDGVVLDPFAGTGTFLLAAARLGRTAYGADQNADMVRIAKERGCE